MFFQMPWPCAFSLFECKRLLEIDPINIKVCLAPQTERRHLNSWCRPSWNWHWSSVRTADQPEKGRSQLDARCNQEVTWASGSMVHAFQSVLHRGDVQRGTSPKAEVKAQKIPPFFSPENVQTHSVYLGCSEESPTTGSMNILESMSVPDVRWSDIQVYTYHQCVQHI